MTIRHAIWIVGETPIALASGSLASEKVLEDMIVAAPEMLSEDWMLIGRQERTSFGGWIDLLAIAPDGSLVLIEIKRNQTPREVVAQAIDYASWVERLEADDIVAIYGRFRPGQSLEQDFQQRFGHALDEETLNESHQLVVLAADLDDSTARIVDYLSERDIPINVLCFQIFECEGGQLLSRVWLRDPMEAQASAAVRPDEHKEPWNGEFYANFGAGQSRSWSDAVEYGFISAGGRAWFSGTLGLLNEGDRIWVKVPGAGFVGVGIVKGPREPASTYSVKTGEGEKPILGVAHEGTYHREFLDDPDKCEYFVPVDWLQTVSIEDAVNEIGLFGNQNTVCKPVTPKGRQTVDRLKQRFPRYDG